MLPWGSSSIGKSYCLSFVHMGCVCVCVVFGHLGLCVKEWEVKEISKSALLAFMWIVFLTRAVSDAFLIKS